MQSKPGLVALALLLIVLGCHEDARKLAARDLVAFAKTAPYTIAQAEGKGEPFEVIVPGQALDQYNRVFALFDSASLALALPGWQWTTRTANYRILPRALLFGLNLTTVGATSYRPLFGDTLLAIVEVERPEPDLLFQSLAPALTSSGARAPTPAERDAFIEAMSRSRHELQVHDTLFLWITGVPLVSRMRFATAIRDSLNADSLGRLAMDRFRRLLQTAKLRATWYPGYSGPEPPQIVVGSSQGVVDPGAGGWNRDEHGEPIGDVYVDCEETYSDKTELARRFLDLPAVQGDQTVVFDCLGWSSRNARGKLERVRFRLVSYADYDSLVGPWVVVH